MKRTIVLLMVAAFLFAMSGCEATGKRPDNGCCEKYPYNPKGQMLKGYEGKVHCDTCGKDMPAGKWCAKCNRFMLEGTVHCDKCNMDIPKGKWCAKCEKYVGVEGVSYCAKCDQPYNTVMGCPGCK